METNELLELRSIDVNGMRIRWHERGSGQPVVLLHGIPTTPQLWRYVLPQLRGMRALAWEMVGYGTSIPEGRNRDISVTRQADYLDWWMDVINLERAVLVGHDLGGGLAQIMALRYPGRVQGLVLMNSICYDSWPIPEVRLMRASGALVERLPAGVVRAGLQAVIFSRGHNSAQRARESLDLHWSHYLAADGPAALMRQVRALNTRDTLATADNLTQIDAPARLVWGASDPFQKIGYGYRLAYDLGARLDRIEGGRHFVPEDHPERVAAAIQTLVEVDLPRWRTADQHAA
jgi:pimeloyl-ACP methyl ester carboxylesterase